MNPYQPPNPYQQQYPQQYPQQPPYQPPSYEFGEAENSIIKSCATWTMVLGIIQILEGASKLFGEGKSTLNLIVHVAMGVLLIVASQSLTKVVTTQGQDIPHLMKALDNFGQVLLIRIILLVFALIIAVIAVVAILAVLAAIAH
ncbi:MAG: hypothetical protein HYV09_39895 [Deltaproteobacteria bacterium]|nr:hypothetical protein [Deltaproteobacteria bacterium]